ncbi:hypothetical protein ElP_70580 (plasmid) [Tautonia plasticadhaerens]|uniref:Uncharacterized protein n=1 Tax=Tautonia plasticadhaerens TaxID=2527974 RepID=A0A518HE14_9BACT|nr:hypothetical protein ElP_70580 [Tautonia plasticadhaerens]
MNGGPSSRPQSPTPFAVVAGNRFGLGVACVG